MHLDLTDRRFNEKEHNHAGKSMQQLFNTSDARQDALGKSSQAINGGHRLYSPQPFNPRRDKNFRKATESNGNLW